MRRALAAVAALAAVLVVSGGASAAKGRIGDQALVPVAAGPVAGVTTEDRGYNGFPAVVVPEGKRALVAYGSATTHDGPLSSLMVRRSDDGVVWSEASVVPLSPDGYAYTPGGAIGAETAAQGGRIYLAVQRAHWPATGGHTPDEQRYWVYTSDDDAATWQQRAQFPTSPGTWGIGAGNMLVLPDGNLLFAGYSSDGVVRFLTSNDRGATVALAGTVSIAGRYNGSPQMGQLSDGRVFCIFRSDLSGGQSRYYYSWRTGASSWSGPQLLSPDATTLGGVTVLSDDTIAIAYRGWADRTDDGPQYRPLRFMEASVTGNSIATWRTNHDLVPSIRARMLGGRLVHLTSGGWICVWGIEGPLTTATAASIVSVPVRWGELP